MQKPEADNTATQSATSVYDLLAWLEVNKKSLLWIAGGLLTVVVACYIYVWQRDRSEAAANAALLALSTEADPNSGKAAAQAADFLRVAQEHSSSLAAGRARVMAAAALYAEGKYAEARQEFGAILASSATSPLAALAQFGVASSLDALDKKDEALAAYQKVVSEHPEDVLAGRAKMSAAALYEAKNQPDQALKLLEELTRPVAAGAGSMEAASRKQQFLQRHPELVKTNPVPVVVNPEVVVPPTNGLNLAPPAGAPPSN